MSKNEEEKEVFRLSFSTSFKKDFKKFKKQPLKLKKIKEITDLLVEKGSAGVPKEKNPHPLIGDYKGCYECHIEPDLLLIWKEFEENIINLERLGSHSELFG